MTWTDLVPILFLTRTDTRPTWTTPAEGLTSAESRSAVPVVCSELWPCDLREGLQGADIREAKSECRKLMRSDRVKALQMQGEREALGEKLSYGKGKSQNGRCRAGDVHGQLRI